jgi:hypothetical protein
MSAGEAAYLTMVVAALVAFMGALMWVQRS